jgi:hypothetical protein
MQRKVVATRIAKLLPPLPYKRTDIQGGEVRKLFLYFISHPQNVVVPLPRRPTEANGHQADAQLCLRVT